MRPALVCCRPHSAHGTSGWVWVHSDNCPDHPNKKIEKHTPTAAALSRVDHPAGTNHMDGGNAAVRTWLQHPRECLCAPCANVDFWLDRDDDDTEVWV